MYPNVNCRINNFLLLTDKKNRDSMKKIYLSIVFLALTVLLSGFGSEKNKTTTPQQFNHKGDLVEFRTSAEKIAGIDSLLQSFVDQKKVSSVVGFIAKDGNVVYSKAFGWKDIENKIQASVDDYYILFSQTKAVVTVAFM